MEGPSPRVRGNPRRREPQATMPGTIPAGAGEPSPWVPVAGRGRDHPRGCGGTPGFTTRSFWASGPSPRVRGNLAVPDSLRRASGTIPAGAGEPSRATARQRRFTDHPRGCGGTHPVPAGSRVFQGPSPRVRGNLWGGGWHVTKRRTIPAGAGEPGSSAAIPATARDHPRGCGGTDRPHGPDQPRPGPSPRVRGNRGRHEGYRPPEGTIPAGAGEPRARSPKARLAGDHPRGCGGTWLTGGDGARTWGPSPRVRGNHRMAVNSAYILGTIPAGAGEPRHRAALSGRGRDHPRGCGGTSCTLAGNVTSRGPSPRVRGNPQATVLHETAHGTIPAGAGEPCLN